LDKQKTIKTKKMNYKETLEKVKNGEFTESTEETTYEKNQKVKVQIQECLIVDLDTPQVEHWLIDTQAKKNDESPIIAFKLLVTFEDGETIETVEADNFLTQKGDKMKYFKSFEANGDIVPASLLYEITKRCRDFSEDQEKKFKLNPFVFIPKAYKDMTFEIEAKKMKEGVKLITEKQAKKDKEYFEKLQAEKTTENKPVEKKENLDLPF
jgi:hypothetical protein